MCCMPMNFRTRLVTVLVTALVVAGVSVLAQDARRGAGNQPDPRVRDNGYSGPQPPPPINGTLKGLHPNGGIILEQGDETGVVAVDRATEIIIRGQADESFVTVGSLAELTGTLEGPRGPISSNYLVLLHSAAKNNVVRDRWQPVLHVSTPMPGETRPVTATIRGQVVSLDPLVIAANSQKVPIRLEQPAQIWIEVFGGEPRSLCKEGDRVDVAFQVPQRRGAVVAQTITITRAEPFKAGDEKVAKAGKKKDETQGEKSKKAMKGKAPAKGKPAKPAAEQSQ